jgi:hypothetical protein
MQRHPVVLPSVLTLKKVRQVAEENKNSSGFPVCREGDKAFVGTVKRSLLVHLLWFIELHGQRRGNDAEPPLPTYRDLQDVADALQWERLPELPPPRQDVAASGDRLLDLTPFVDTSALFVTGAVCVSRVYHLFRSMSLRQLTVVGAGNRVAGVITRRELLGHFMLEKVCCAAGDRTAGNIDDNAAVEGEEREKAGTLSGVPRDDRSEKAS